MAKQIKARPCGILQAAANEIKEKLAQKQQELRDSQDPHEQLRAKTSRISRLTAANKELFTKLAAKVEEEEGATKAANELRDKIKTNRKEIEVLQAQTLSLAGQPNTQSPAAMGNMVDEFKKNLKNRLDDPAIAKEAGLVEKKREVEAAFASIASILQTLQGLDATIQKGIDKAADAATTPGGSIQQVPQQPQQQQQLQQQQQPLPALTADAASGGTAGDGSRTQSEISPTAASSTSTMVVIGTKPPRERSEEELLAPSTKCARTENGMEE